MIYTLTLNPSIDYVIDVENLELGKVNRTSKDFKFPGGKGINVSRILGNQKIDNIALGFLGGFTGKFIEDNLNALGVKTEFIKVKGDSRINVKIKSNEETEINGAGPMISAENLESLFNRLDQLVEGDILVLAGSIPSTLPRDLYLQIQKRVSQKNVKVVVDTSGKALLEAIKNKPFLIKPNNHEIEEIFDVKINSEKELIKYGKDLVSLGAENVIISMAGDGALLITEDGVFKGNAPKGEVKNSVGAGDSLVGGFLAKYVETKDLITSFKNGIASGSASAFSLDLALAEDVNKLLPIIKIEKYEEV
ncbi:1-phosphofructokinase [Clostridium perfringens]|uniref:1-phosphofructokinase n=1 Tax=Clostridium perfringens TaxID=1502 RepID=UPI0028E0B9C9|nr:1-phosphofructokinase [Clostridium perfringens]MDT9337166.1 1-phosphofructokinase [Clostridium perfringens]MDT9344922.1 1-phosphofructokinase [Clostridium perfringens]MDT9348334.1 1-phosphofructokinase [Clostridium perfringens]MDT9354009.1 1-phosphofructokinase [Clostridium perfringens]